MIALLVVLVFVTSLSLDVCSVKYFLAVSTRRPLAAGMWSVLQWGSASVGFIVAVKITLWALPSEAAGMFTGSWLAVRFAGTCLGARSVPRL